MFDLCVKLLTLYSGSGSIKHVKGEFPRDLTVFGVCRGLDCLLRVFWVFVNAQVFMNIRPNQQFLEFG